MGLTYFSEFLNRLLLNARHVQIDLGRTDRPFVIATDQMIDLFAIVSSVFHRAHDRAIAAATGAGQSIPTELPTHVPLGDIEDAVAARANALFSYADIVVFCYDLSAFTPVCKGRVQVERRKTVQPLTPAQIADLEATGYIPNWDIVRATPGVRSHIIHHIIASFADRCYCPPRPGQKLIIHGIPETPSRVLQFEAVLTSPVSATAASATIESVSAARLESVSNIFEIPLIGEADHQIAFWLTSFASAGARIVAAINDTDMIAASLLVGCAAISLGRDPELELNGVYLFRAKDSFNTHAYKFRQPICASADPVGEIPKTYAAPYLEIAGAFPLIAAEARQFNLSPRIDPVLHLVAWMLVTGCDFISARNIPRLSGESQYNTWLGAGPDAPCFVQLRPNPANPERCVLILDELVWVAFMEHRIVDRMKTRPSRSALLALARRMGWVLLYFLNARDGIEQLPNEMALDENNVSIWGWGRDDLGAIVELDRVTERVPPGCYFVESLNGAAQ